MSTAGSKALHRKYGTNALALAIVAFSLFAIGDTFSKFAVTETNIVLAMWGRSVALALMILMMIRPWQSWSTLTRAPVRLLLLRSIFPFLGGVCVIAAVAYMPLAEVTAILFIAPLISMVLGRLLLGERVNGWGWVAVVLGFLGVLIITRPYGISYSWVLLIPALGGVFTSLGQVMTRIVAQRTTWQAVLLYMALVSLTASSLPLPFFWQAPSAKQWLLLALSGFCQAAGQLCMIGAYARATASRVAPYSYAQLLTATAVGLAVFGELPDVFTVIGAAFIVAGGLLSLSLAGREIATPTDATTALSKRISP